MEKNEYELEENQIKQSLLERPSFSVKVRLVLVFCALFLISAVVSVSAMFMLSMIKYRVQYIALTDRFVNEIQHARRSEKNYFIYHSNLSEVLVHLDNANVLLEQASMELGHVVGREEINTIHGRLKKYRQMVDRLIEKENDPGFKKSREFGKTSKMLRNYGSEILEFSLDVSKKERELVSRTIVKAKRVHIVLLAAMLFLSIFIASHIYRHIIVRLNILMEATQRFASGNFLPITPKRKYKDEFSNLAIALNHMMYELDKRQSLLAESLKLRAIGNLTAGVAHELNNPLNNIILTSEILKDGYRELSDEERQDMINDLVIQGERASQVVKNLLDFVRKSETKTEYLYVDKLIDETLQLAKNQIRLQKIELDKTAGKNLPPIYGDRKLLIQVFLNLIINAIDAMPGGGKLSIDIREKSEKGLVSIQISDTGTGIPENIIKSIFNPFFTTKPTGKGTGLGLAVSKGIIEKHDGTIEVKSRANEGSTFTIHLPVVPIPAEVKARLEKPENQQTV